ncbi:MAG: DNA repair protein RadA [candidate division Zixibacteria bacterium]|jgi:DNA repair protein RadA/Sms|nr:DNA repair protein RadA [candidate division Zixibacteria bacterium]
MSTRRKIKTAYFCSQCGAEHPKWQGQCRECGAWNSLIEERAPVRKAAPSRPSAGRPTRIVDIQPESREGYVSGIPELDRVLGGRILPGMTVLLGGEPGIGKSTLLLQAADAYSRAGLPVLYVTGEESLPQVKIRAQRLELTGENVTVVNCTEVAEILSMIAAGEFAVVLIDSIQTVASEQFDSPPGTVGQIRECAGQLIRAAKTEGCALYLVGHITKEGMIAGPKVLEHMVDTVVYFEGDSAHLYRILRVTKNRFGSVSEIGLFQMTSRGLMDVANPSSFFLTENDQPARTGAAVTGICEGNRPLLVEVQALVSSAAYGNPQRVAGGIDGKRLSLLLAILEKRCGYPMGTHDVFVSVAGGLKLTEPSIDLAVMAAIVSSLQNRSIASGTLVVGEVGLSGEVRGITMVDRRIAEATKLGYTTAVIPKGNMSQVGETTIEIIGVSDLQGALEKVIG